MIFRGWCQVSHSALYEILLLIEQHLKDELLRLTQPGSDVNMVLGSADDIAVVVNQVCKTDGFIYLTIVTSDEKPMQLPDEQEHCDPICPDTVDPHVFAMVFVRYFRVFISKDLDKLLDYFDRLIKNIRQTASKIQDPAIAFLVNQDTYNFYEGFLNDKSQNRS